MGSLPVCDVLVVGGGMAGLTASAYLAKAGRQVLLCDKEAKTGGLVNSFEYKGFVFDGGIRAIESSGVVLPMLRQLGVEVEFVHSPVAIGIGPDVIQVSSMDSLHDYEELLGKHFPESRADIARILQAIRQVMAYMDVLYGIDNPLFLDLKNDPQYVFRTILPWLVKYALTMPRIQKLNLPVVDYLSRFSDDQALLDLIAQHFFQETPAFFALGYFSLYLDYRYPRGGTGTLAAALDRCARESGAEIRTGTMITRVDPGRHEAVDAAGHTYRYKKLLWAADAKTLYRILDLSSLAGNAAVGAIQARQKALEGKVGGDSVFTVYLTLNLDTAYFRDIAAAHFFYTPSVRGLSHARLDDLRIASEGGPAGFVSDRERITAWVERYLDLTTYEISCPALRDARLAPEGQTGLIVSSLFDYALTKHIQEVGWYEEFRKLAAERIVSVLDASIFPGLKAAVIDSFTSTPLTLEKVAGNAEGAITGWAFTNEPMPAVNTLARVASSVVTPIPDICQAGQWTFSPSGLPISVMTGKLAADRILKELTRAP